MCKHMKKVRSSHKAILVLNSIKHRFFLDNTTQHEFNTRQHETTRVQYDTTRVKYDSIRVQRKLGQQKQGSNLHFLLLNYTFS